MARELGFTHVSLSSAIMPMARIVPRGFTGLIYLNYCNLSTVRELLLVYFGLLIIFSFLLFCVRFLYSIFLSNS